MAWWLSWLERRPVTAEVVGSNPIRVVKKKSGSRLLFCVNKNIETEPLKGPKFRKPRTETVEFCALFTAPPIVRPATQTRTRCVLKQGSPV